ncbi:hypothetical protein KRX57_01605 [Weeksellaceae bacterium TAE3-ERU29]|nr:hypothetical protein [Weeksellaceae bacterium TAE3-ERU29]
MKIRVFENYNKEYPEDKIVCLNTYSENDITQFIVFIKNVIKNPNLEHNLSKENFIDSDINLFFQLDEKDVGIEKKQGNYICKLTLTAYENIIELLYKDDLSKGYQWLYDTLSQYELLLSNKCKW